MKPLIPVVAVGMLLFLPFGGSAQTTPTPSPAQPRTVDLGRPPHRGALTAALPPQMLPQLALPSLSVNTYIRRASRNFYIAIYPPSEGVSPDWTGDVATGVAGTTSQNFQQAVNLRVNFLRAYAGVPAAITFNSTYSADDQLDALMTSANNTLSHTPPSTWIDYTAAGALAAANSNLYLGEFGPDAMTGYIQDPGSSNAEMGHRRWLLYPPTLQMGTGDIPTDPTGVYNSANSLWVVTPEQQDPAVRDGFVGWPFEGYIPYQFVFPRWSFSLQNADFSSATVAVTLNGASVATVIDSTNATGYGDNTLVWHLASTPDGSAPYPEPASDQSYTVTVSKVMVSGVAHNYTYPVTVFDPAVLGPDDILPTLSGPGTVAPGSTTDYPFTSLPEASNYDVLSAAKQNVNWVEGAESQTLELTPQTTGTYSSITSITSASGSNCFQLCQDGFNNQDLLLNSQFIVSANSSISFDSLIGYMTPTQFAEVQVSTDDGQTWNTVFSQAGTNSGATSFTPVSISLSAYANRLIRIRFLLDYTSGSAYTQSNPASGPNPGFYYGWLLDNIAPTNISQAASVLHTNVNTTRAPFVAPAATTPSVNVLVVRAMLFNAYPVEYGPVQNIFASPPSLNFQNGALLGILSLNSSYLPSAWQGVGAMNSGWQERAVADINGDGIPDIIFQNGTLLGALIMNASGAPTAWVGIGEMNAGWELDGAGSITGDGNLDLIFQNGTLLGFLEVNSSGQPVSWNGIGAMGAGWQLHAVTYLSGDGQPDLLFQNGTLLGALEVNTSGLPTSWHGIGAMNAGWTLSATLDVTGSGQPDLIFQNGTLLGALTLNTSFQPVAWHGIGAMGSGWTLPGDY